MTVLSAPEMRFGTKQDVPFIIAVIRDGMRDGYFNFDDDDGLSQFESQISEAIARRERERIAPISCLSLMLNIMAQR